MWGASPSAAAVPSWAARVMHRLTLFGFNPLLHTASSLGEEIENVADTPFKKNLRLQGDS